MQLECQFFLCACFQISMLLHFLAATGRYLRIFSQFIIILTKKCEELFRWHPGKNINLMWHPGSTRAIHLRKKHRNQKKSVATILK